MSWNYVSRRHWENCPKNNRNYCEHCKRSTFSTRHECMRGGKLSAVGFSHAFRYCTKHQCRVSEVKGKCEGGSL